MNVPRADREKIFAKVCRLVREKHFNPGLNGVNWEQLTAEKSEEILNATDSEQFENLIQKLLGELRTSHTGFFHKNKTHMPARHAINATLKNCLVGGNVRWVFQDVHEGGSAHAAKIHPGDVLLALDDVEIAPPVVPLFHLGRITTLIVQRPRAIADRIRVDVPNPKNSKHPINVPRALSHLHLPDRIGYLKVTMFPGAVGIDLAKGISAAITKLSSPDRLIVDLRGNTGGGIGGLRLMSYLTPNRCPIGYSLTRKRAQSGYRKEELKRFERIPSTKAILPWLILKYGIGDKSICLYTEALGPQKFHGRIVLLVNEHSASAAEMLAAFAVENKLAKIVGSKTAGRLLSGSAFHVGGGYVLGVPTAAYLTWNGRSLEGKGISPDLEIDATYESLSSGEDVQMLKAIELVKQL